MTKPIYFDDLLDSKPTWKAESYGNNRLGFGVFLGFSPFTVIIHFWSWIVGVSRFRRLKPIDLSGSTNAPSQ